MPIGTLLRQCSFSRRYQGYLELQECIRIALEYNGSLPQITEIYRRAAEKFGVSWCGIEKNIHTSLNYAWKRNGKTEMENLFGGIFYEMPTSGEVILMFADYILDHPTEL